MSIPLISRTPNRALRCGEGVRFVVKVARRECAAPRLKLCDDNLKEYELEFSWFGMEREYDLFECCVHEKFPCGLLRYEILGILGRITIYPESYITPEWFSRGVTYHVFIDRFCRLEAPKSDFFKVHSDTRDEPDYLPDEKGEILNRDIYGGSLAGVMSKLEYFKQLGVRTIYLSPMFEAWSNHKYNTGDYMRVDSHFGTEQDFRLLCKRFSENGIRIILDGVFSHTGSDSVYFNAENRYDSLGAAQSADSEYRKWYNIDENGKYDSWWGIKTLPQVNELNESYREFTDRVIDKWMDCGASGWRLDVADELPDEFIAGVYRRARKNKSDALVIGEVWEDASDKIAYGVRKRYFTQPVLDGVMNYPLKNAIIDFLTLRIDAQELSRVMLSLMENYPEPAHRCLMNIIGTHDTPRAITALGVPELANAPRSFKANYAMDAEKRHDALELLKLASAIAYFYPGSPTIYYGDEIGMEGFEDPFNRRFFEWDRHEPELFLHYKRLGQLKTTRRALHEGTLSVVEAHGGLIKLTRECEADKISLLVDRDKRRFFIE